MTPFVIGFTIIFLLIFFYTVYKYRQTKSNNSTNNTTYVAETPKKSCTTCGCGSYGFNL